MSLVKNIRDTTGLTLEKIAEHVGVSYGTARKWSNGSVEPSGPNMLALEELRRRNDPLFVPASNGATEELGSGMTLTPWEQELVAYFRRLPEPDRPKWLARIIEAVASQPPAALTVGE